MPRLVVEVVGDVSALEKSFARASRDSSKFGRDMERSGRSARTATVGFVGLGRALAPTAAALLGAGGLIVGLKQSVDAASNLNEQTAKTEVVFGRAAKGVEDWSKTTSSAMGLASDQALATASSFGALLTPIGITGQAAAAQSVKLTKLGADLASFYNTSVSDALDAIKSGLVGEVEPLRRYGVLLSETRVQQEALVETGKTHASSLTASEKLLARQALIYRDTAKAQGDFTRTSGGFANQTRILGANLRQFEIILGQALIPTLTDLITKTNEWLSKSENQKRIQDDVTEAADKGAKTVKFLSDAYGVGSKLLGPWVKGNIEAQKALIKVDTIVLKNLGSMSSLNLLISEQTAANKDLAASQDLVAKGYSTIEAARAEQTAADFAIARQTQAKASGRFLLPGAGTQVTDAQRRAIALAQTAGTGTAAEVAAVNEQLAADDKALAFARARIASGKGNLKKFADAVVALETDRNSLLSRLESISSANAAAAEAAREKIRSAQEKRREAFRDILSGVVLGVSGDPLTLGQVRQAGIDAEQKRVFQILGLTSTGDAKGPSQGNLQAALKAAQAKIAGGPLDTKAMQSRLAKLRSVVNSEFSQLTRDTKFKVAEFLDALNPKGAALPFTARHGLNLAAATAGLGLTNPQRSALRGRLAGQHLTVEPPVVHVYVGNNEVEKHVTIEQKKTARRQAVQTRGKQAP
jgi:hypothetical protein